MRDDRSQPVVDRLADRERFCEHVAFLVDLGELFGDSRVSGSSTTNAFTYTGREDDRDGLYFYRLRYYDARVQRFISEDPIEFASHSVNLYQYSSSNPISNRDPLGLVA